MSIAKKALWLLVDLRRLASNKILGLVVLTAPWWGSMLATQHGSSLRVHVHSAAVLWLAAAPALMFAAVAIAYKLGERNGAKTFIRHRTEERASNRENAIHRLDWSAR